VLLTGIMIWVLASVPLSVLVGRMFAASAVADGGSAGRDESAAFTLRASGS